MTRRSNRTTPVAIGIGAASLLVLLPLARAQVSSDPLPVRRIIGLTGEQAEILGHLSLVYLSDGLGGQVKTIRISGVNVQLVNGLGTTASINGAGNLVLGYDEDPPFGGDRGGSHNLVVGSEHSYGSHGGAVFGHRNSSLAPFTSIVGGTRNIAATDNAAILGGADNRAQGLFSTVSGGSSNFAVADYSSVAGGEANRAGGLYGSVAGGFQNFANFDHSTIAGGLLNLAVGRYGAVSGGEQNVSGGAGSVVGGGRQRIAFGDHDWTAGGLLEDN